MAELIPNGCQQFLDANGNPLVGGLVYFYIPNTTTPKDTWQDAAKSALNTNPVVCDARGQATIYGEGSYRQILKDASGNQIWDKTVSPSANQNGDGTQNFNVASLNGGQLAGMRNKIINGAFQINQSGYASGSATTAGQYTLDLWKVTGTGGITFSTTAGKTTVTIPAGQTLQQVIEAANLPAGDYVLSWEGTAQGRIDGGTYGASGTVTVALAGGVNSTVEFNAGTLANVQFEPSAIATPFEYRMNELALCQRYFMAIDTVTSCAIGVASANLVSFTFNFPAMRASPVVRFTDDNNTVGNVRFNTGNGGLLSRGAPQGVTVTPSSIEIWDVNTTKSFFRAYNLTLSAGL